MWVTADPASQRLVASSKGRAESAGPSRIRARHQPGPRLYQHRSRQPGPTVLKHLPGRCDDAAVEVRHTERIAASQRTKKAKGPRHLVLARPPADPDRPNPPTNPQHQLRNPGAILARLLEPVY